LEAFFEMTAASRSSNRERFICILLTEMIVKAPKRHRPLILLLFTKEKLRIRNPPMTKKRLPRKAQPSPSRKIRNRLRLPLKKRCCELHAVNFDPSARLKHVGVGRLTRLVRRNSRSEWRRELA
jgi:hypothetical protein